MAAGLPGTGIGGLFFILSAFFMILVETQRTIRGRSSLARWRIVGRHAAVAATMVAAATAAIWLVHRLVFSASSKAGAENGKASGLAHQLVPYLPLLITLAVLTLVLLTGYLAKFVFSRHTTPVRPRPPTRTALKPLLPTTSPPNQ